MNLLILVLILVMIVVLVLSFLLRTKGVSEKEFLSKIDSVEKMYQRLENIVRDEISKNRQEISSTLVSSINTFLQTMQQQIYNLQQMVENQLQYLNQESSKKLDQIREVVDEKLQSTLENRLGIAFKHVSDRLELVHKGLGEMQALATDVGDLKKILSNVKIRGMFGEIQLKNILQEILTPEQYLENVNIKKETKEVVEFAIKIPSKGEENRFILLPIDSKFPIVDYEKIAVIREKNDLESFKEFSKNLSQRILAQAKDIRDKYINPPHTTDFAIMFLPVEGLFAEVLNIPGLFERVRREYSVIITGPTTITAILNSLQMGFRTLAIEKRSSEVWRLLSTVKTEFSKFGDLLEKTSKKIREAYDTIEDASKKTRTIEHKLKSVEELPLDRVERVVEDKVLELEEKNEKVER